MDNSNGEKDITSNTNAEKETTVDSTAEKKKKKRKTKGKKKKINCNFTSEIETTDNVSAGSETVNAENKTTENATSETKTTDDANTVQGIIYTCTAELQTNNNVEKEIDNIDAETETTVNSTGEKKKKRKAKAKKKKNDCNFNAEKETTENVNAGSEPINAEIKTTAECFENATPEKKTADNANAVQRIIDTGSAEIETTDNAEKESNDNVDAEQKIPNDAAPDDYFYEYLTEVSIHFAINFNLYLTRCYDIFNLGCSDIKEEEIDLPQGCRVLLRGSIGRYKSTNYYNKYYPYTYRQYRYEELKATFRQILVITGQSVTHSEFLRLGALYVLAAYDLRTRATFNEAKDSAIDALVEAILETKQREFVRLWYPFSQEG